MKGKERKAAKEDLDKKVAVKKKKMTRGEERKSVSRDAFPPFFISYMYDSPT